MTLRRLRTTFTEEKSSRESMRRASRMYVCGPTVYDCAHIGNARPVIVFDLLFRLLAPYLWRDARYLCPQHHRRRRQDQCARCGAEHPDSATLTERDRDQRQFHADIGGARVPARRRIEPRATEHIDAMTTLIERADRPRPSPMSPRAMSCARRRALDVPRLRRARPPLAGRDDRRRARRGGALQAQRAWISCCGSRPRTA